MATVMTIDAKLRQNARAALNVELDKLFNPLTSKAQYLSGRESNSKFAHSEGGGERMVPSNDGSPATRETVLSVRQLLAEARNIIYNSEVAQAEQRAVDAFEQKVDGLQDQLDELRDVVDNLPQR